MLREAIHDFSMRAPITEANRFLTEEQAVYIVTQSDAPNAIDTKAAVDKTFVAWLHGHLAPDADVVRSPD